METVIEAIYEDGVFKPLKKINLPKGTKVKLKILKAVISHINKRHDDRKINQPYSQLA